MGKTKRNLLCIASGILVIFAAVSCGSGNDYDDYEKYIDSVSLLAIEGGVAYWDVYLTDDADWGGSNDEGIALCSIKECLSSSESEGAVSYDVMGYEYNGNNAFSWGGIDGTNEIRYYKDGIYSHNYFLIESQYEYIGYE